MPRKNFLDDENTDVGPMSLVCAGGPDSRDFQSYCTDSTKNFKKKSKDLCELEHVILA